MANPIADTFTNYNFGNVMQAVFVGTMLSLGINILSWFWASYFGDDRIKMWVKRELMQLFYTIIIGVVVLLLVYGPFLPRMMELSALASGNPEWALYVSARCAIQAGPMGGQLPCHISIATDYLDVLFKMGVNLAHSILSAFTFMSVLQSLSLEVKGMQETSSQLTVTPLIGLSIPIDTLSTIFDLSLKNLMAVRFQQFFLDFLHLALFPLFLTLGLILRSLFFTRRLGGLLIALALSFYIIFPMMYSFFFAMFFDLEKLNQYTNYEGLGAWQADYTMENGQLDLTGCFATGLPLNEIKNGASVPDSTGGGADLARVSGVVQASGNEKTFSGLTANDGWKQFYAIERGGTVTVCNLGKFPAGMLSLVPNDADTRFVLGATTDRKAAYTDFRKIYGDPNDPNWQDDPEKVTTFGSDVLMEICPATVLTADQKDLRQEQTLVARRTMFDWLFQDYAGGIMMMIDPGSSLVGKEGRLLGWGGPIDLFASLLVMTLIAPFIAIMASLASVKVLSPLLGGDVEIAGLTRII